MANAEYARMSAADRNQKDQIPSTFTIRKTNPFLVKPKMIYKYQPRQ